MMAEEHSENGHINKEGEEVLDINGVEDKKLNLDSNTPPSKLPPDINSPRHHLSAAPKSEAGTNEEPEMEFFDQKRRDSYGEQEEGEGEGSSPGQRRDKDTDSFHSRGFAMISPPQSPAVAMSSASADLFGEDEEADQLRVLAMEDSDEIVKSKPDSALLQVSGLRAEKEDTAVSKLVMLKEKCEDLEVDIVSREKVEEKDSYIRYKIFVKSSRLEKPEYKVWRRYRDFEWLRDVTVKTYPTLIVPPLPGKQLARYFDQKSDSFLEERQHALQRFLQRMCVHPYFAFNRHLKVFLTAEPEEFTSYLAEMSGANRILGAVTSSVKFAANSLRLKDPDPEFSKASKYFEELGTKLGVVERISTRIHTEREEYVDDLDEFGSAVKQWSLNEGDVATPIQQMGTCLDNCSTALQKLNESNAYSVLMAAKEYQLYCAAGVSAVRQRDGVQLERDRMSDDREKKKKVHNEAASAGKLQKLPKLADDLQKVGVEAERSLDELSVANEKLRVDIEKWTEAKDRELGELMTHWASNNISYHNKCFGEWEKVLRILREPELTGASSFTTKQSEDIYTPLVPGGVASASEVPHPRTLKRETSKEDFPDLFN